MFLLFLESTSEIFFILIAALVLFGPRKLPQLSRTIGKSLAEFKRASEEFKRTWEQEVAMESSQKEARIEQAMLPPDTSPPATAIERGSIVDDTTRESPGKMLELSGPGMPVDAGTPAKASLEYPALNSQPPAQGSEPVPQSSTSKRDWL